MDSKRTWRKFPGGTGVDCREQTDTYALMVKWISRNPAEVEFWVRLPVGVPLFAPVM